MKILVSALVVSALIVSSCGSKSSEKDYESTVVAVPATGTEKKNTGVEQILGQNNTQPTAVQVPVTASNATTQAAPMPVAVNAATAASPATAKGLNPAHGQPGHRCDIAVGAPLSAAATTPPQPQAQPQPITVKQNAPAIIPTQVKTAPVAAGMNPAHGQPGHRCDIAVGAPLNSKPAAAKPTATVQPTQPGITQTPAQVTATAPGMNPPHGQPGHRCDIGVGTPLNSAPAKKDSGK